MIIIDFLNRLIGRPPSISDGDGIILEEDTQEYIARRINGGGFYIPPPPPPIPMYSTPKGEPLPPMVSEIVNKIISEPVRTTPSTTSSLWCGTTVTDTTSTLTNEIDPYVLDHKPLKRMLMKLVPWVLDVKEVRVKKFFGT